MTGNLYSLTKFDGKTWEELRAKRKTEDDTEKLGKLEKPNNI